MAEASRVPVRVESEAEVLRRVPKLQPAEGIVA
jgi:hypothetical protein